MKLPGIRAYPRELKIRNEVWSLKFVRRLNDQHQRGECDPSTKTLSVLKGLDHRDVLSTVVHEILHAIEEEWDIKLSAKRHKQGDRLYRLEEALVDFLLQNF